MKRILKLFVAVILILIGGSCSTGGLTWSDNPYRGSSKRVETVNWSNPTESFAFLARHLASNGYKLRSFSGELLIANFRYDFVGSETWSGAKSTLSKVAEPLGKGLMANPYGKNAWLDLDVSLQASKDSGAALQMVFTFMTQGEVGGVGGAGPFPLNSTGVFEQELVGSLRKDFLPAQEIITNTPNSRTPVPARKKPSF